MSRPTILGIDIDGVLADFVGAYTKLLVERHGKPLPEAPLQFDYPVYCGYTQAEVDGAWEWIYQHPEWWEMLALLAPRDCLSRRPDDAHLYFVTNRPMRRGVKEATERWLADNFHDLDYPTVILTKRKGDAANALHLDRFIDDRPENLRAVREARPKTGLSLCRRSWNHYEQGLWACVDGVEQWLSGQYRPSGPCKGPPGRTVYV